MAIVTGAPETRPALQYDKVHIESYSLRIEKVAPYRYVLDMLARRYADDGSGNRVFHERPIQFSNSDFERATVEWMIGNGHAADAADAAAKRAAARTAVNDEFAAGTLDMFKLMAYFELALGLQLEIGAGEPVGGIS